MADAGLPPVEARGGTVLRNVRIRARIHGGHSDLDNDSPDPHMPDPPAAAKVGGLPCDWRPPRKKAARPAVRAVEVGLAAGPPVPISRHCICKRRRGWSGACHEMRCGNASRAEGEPPETPEERDGKMT